MQLSEHFSLEELVASATAKARRISNRPDDLERANLERLCTTLLEPARMVLRVGLHVNSGFRCPELNAAVGGMKASAHLSGRAADVVPLGLPIEEAFHKLCEAPQQKLPFDQLILETNHRGAVWLHLAIAAEGKEPRRMAFRLTKNPNRESIG
ncbi:MAG TPA: D-Ala-D-Ala carboxypeptidase family metallohydrolase [Holophagaceae bacterium]|nr:D-Ala-D-Ala carboxypeptidase family metallohydrolase [Holophagaceae bacterium]